MTTNEVSLLSGPESRRHCSVQRAQLQPRDFGERSPERVAVPGRRGPRRSQSAHRHRAFGSNLDETLLLPLTLSPLQSMQHYLRYILLDNGVNLPSPHSFLSYSSFVDLSLNAIFGREEYILQDR